MNAGARYGLFLGFATTALLMLSPEPAGFAVVLAVLAAQLAAGAVLVWRRTGLKYATASLVAGAVGLGVMAYLSATGADFLALPAGWSAALAVLLVSGPVLFAVEARMNPDKWRAWREFMAHKSIPDVLLGRHIPRLR